MSLTFDIYWPLALLLLVPYIWWAQRATLTDFADRQQKLSAAVRSAIVVLLLLSLMQPVIQWSGGWISVVYLLDVSQSVSPRAIESSMQWIAEATGQGRPDHVRFVPFGANSTDFDTLEALRQVRVSPSAGQGSVDQSATNIEDAVSRALRGFAPHYLKRLVLISDGNENSGSMIETMQRLKDEGVRVYTVPVGQRSNGDTWVETILAPSQVMAEEVFPLEVHVDSQGERPAVVEIRSEGKSLGTRNVQLKDGLNRIGFETTLKETGPVTVEAEVRVNNDPFNANNVYREAVVVKGKSRILYVEGRPESAQYLEQALKSQGLDVEIRPPARIPVSVADIDRFDAVILSDVPRSQLSQAQMNAMATYVRELGGGFILAGGESNYGADGGYSDTPVEEILPVKFSLKQEKEDASLAMVVVLDKSGSMGGQKIELAKEATKAAVDVMKDDHRFGVVVFDYNFHWAVRLQAAANRVPIRQSISMIAAGGETNIYPALREAYIALMPVQAQVKHVILLSDGRSLPDDYQSLVAKMTEAKMTVSAVAVGSGADRELLANLARWGDGRSYYIEDAREVPQIFTRETQMAARDTLVEEPFKPVVKKTAEIFKGIDFATAPSLLGYVATQAKETAEVLLEGREEDPILVRWRYGLGKTAAFTSDVKNRWAVEWLNWSGYGKFWAQMVRETMRRQEDGEFDFRIERRGDMAHISIQAVEKDGRFRNRLRPQVRIVAPDQSATVLNVLQVGPGSYDATFPLAQKGAYVFRAVGDEMAGTSRTLAYSYPEEFHFYPPNTDLLREISDGAGGKFQPQISDVFATNGETARFPIPLWPYFSALALGLYVVDILLRRVRLFET